MLRGHIDQGECGKPSSTLNGNPVHITGHTPGTVSPGRIEVCRTDSASGRHDPARRQFLNEASNLGLIDVQGKIPELHLIPPEYVDRHNLPASAHIMGHADRRIPHLTLPRLPPELFRN